MPLPRCANWTSLFSSKVSTFIPVPQIPCGKRLHNYIRKITFFHGQINYFYGHSCHSFLYVYQAGSTCPMRFPITQILQVLHDLCTASYVVFVAFHLAFRSWWETRIAASPKRQFIYTAWMMIHMIRTLQSSDIRFLKHQPTITINDVLIMNNQLPLLGIVFVTCLAIQPSQIVRCCRWNRRWVHEKGQTGWSLKARHINW